MHSAAAAAAAIAQAVKASGAIVRMEPDDFRQIVYRADNPLVVVSKSRILGRTSHKYLTSYKGLAFYTKSSSQLDLGGGVEVVAAKTIWIPG